MNSGISDSGDEDSIPKRVLVRRDLIKGGFAASLAILGFDANAASAADGGYQPSATAKAPKAHGLGGGDNIQSFLDRIAISQLVLRERMARESHDFDAEEACFTPDATVEVSWFKGSAKDFVGAARKAHASGRQARLTSFDSLGPPVVWINGSRAIADGGCTIRQVLALGGADACMTSFTRILWRLREGADGWRIDRMSCVYIHDTLEAVVPKRIPQIDHTKLATFRPSYRNLSYVLDALGVPIRDDLPGLDRPDQVAALREAEHAWLAQA